MISYQGRILTNGVAFTGTGQFKFALVNGAGSVTYWSNDGTSTGGSAPAAAVSLAPPTACSMSCSAIPLLPI